MALTLHPIPRLWLKHVGARSGPLPRLVILPRPWVISSAWPRYSAVSRRLYQCVAAAPPSGYRSSFASPGCLGGLAAIQNRQASAQ